MDTILTMIIAAVYGGTILFIVYIPWRFAASSSHVAAVSSSPMLKIRRTHRTAPRKMPARQRRA
jgi:hypothetical protein